MHSRRWQWISRSKCRRPDDTVMRYFGGKLDEGNNFPSTEPRLRDLVITVVKHLENLQLRKAKGESSTTVSMLPSRRSMLVSRILFWLWTTRYVSPGGWLPWHCLILIITYDNTNPILHLSSSRNYIDYLLYISIINWDLQGNKGLISYEIIYRQYIYKAYTKIKI